MSMEPAGEKKKNQPESLGMAKPWSWEGTQILVHIELLEEEGTIFQTLWV